MQIQERALAWSLGRAEVHEIDSLNILHATMLAMTRAVEGLATTPQDILIDGNRVPGPLQGRATAVVGGDDLHDCISAASILAKVARDREMAAMEQTYPGYGFDRHKGYPTKVHLAALDSLGVTPIHRLNARLKARRCVSSVSDSVPSTSKMIALCMPLSNRRDRPAVRCGALVRDDFPVGAPRDPDGLGRSDAGAARISHQRRAGVFVSGL